MANKYDGLDTISAEARADVHTGCVATTSCGKPEHYRNVIGQRDDTDSRFFFFDSEYLHTSPPSFPDLPLPCPLISLRVLTSTHL